MAFTSQLHFLALQMTILCFESENARETPKIVQISSIILVNTVGLGFRTPPEEHEVRCFYDIRQDKLRYIFVRAPKS